MDFPFSLTESNLRKALADRRYYDSRHPDSAAWRDMVSRGWATLYPDGSLRGGPIDSLPRHQGADGHIYASDGTRVAQASGGFAHVRDYTPMADGQPVAVRDHDRSPPSGGARPPLPTNRTLPAAHAAPFNPALGDFHTPPAWKAEVFKGQPGAWSGFNDAVGKLSDAGEAERFAYGQIYAAEGGNAKDPKGSASSGILQRTLDDARARVPGLENAASPGDLGPHQRAAIYRDYFDQALRTAGGHQALDKIGNRHAAAALADVIFRFGPGDGARIVQRAIDEVAPGSLEIDGKMGPKTMTSFNTLAADAEKLRALLDAIGTFRDLRTDGQEKYRNKHFRF